MSEIIRMDINEDWAHSGIIKAGDFCFLGYCVGNVDGTVEEQINGAFDDMERRLSKFGLELENVVKMDCLFRDIWNIPTMEKVIMERFNGKYPVRKSIQTEFAHDGLQFQADAIAYCGDLGKGMADVKWIFFDIGSTLIDESTCYKIRYIEAVSGTDISPSDFEKKVIEFAKQNKQGDHEAVKFYGVKLPLWHKELEKPYDDAEVVLKELKRKGYNLGIIANQSFGTKDRLEKWGLLKYIDLVFASAEEGVAKPDSEIFKRALTAANCPPNNAVMVGDRLDNDIVPAKSIGMRTVRVKQGLGGLASVMHECERADYEVDSLSELLELVFI